MTTLPQTSPMRLPRPSSSHLAIPSSNGHAPALAHAPAPAPGLTGADAWRTIRANLWLIIGLFVASGVAGYFVNMWLAANYARYTSTALIRVQVPSELPRYDDNQLTLVTDPSPASIEVEQQTQASSIMNRYFLGSLLENPSSPIRQTAWFQQWGSRIEEAKEDLLEKLDVAPKQNTRLIMVSMSCANPKDALVIVREVVQRHIDDRKKRMKDMQVTKSQDLQNLIDRYRNEQWEARSKVEKLAKDLAEKLGNGEGQSGLDAEFIELMRQENQAEKELGEAQADLATFTKLVKMELTPPELTKALGQSSSTLDENIDALETELQVEMDRWGPDNQHVKDLQKRLQVMHARADERNGTNREKAIAAVQEVLKAKEQMAERVLGTLTAKLAATHNAQISQTQNTLDYKRWNEQEKTVSELLRKAQTERDKLELQIEQGNWATAEWAMQPDLPDRPSFPKLWLTLTLALSLGLVLGLGIAFLREMMDTSVRSPRDIARVGQLNLLGLIPHEADDPEAQGARLPLAIYEAPHSVIAEQFRQVRTRLQHSASLDTVRSLLVTGTSPGDGKTVVACNLAAGLALNGRRILLVDCNFRRPQIHTVFNIGNEIGFGDVLNSLDAFDDAVRETEVPNLSVITSGNKPANPTELLESQLLIDFIERALEEYDHVIFDTGPMLLVSETAALAPRVDGVVTVVRARGNSRGLLQRLRDQLRQLKAEHLGVILNAVRSTSGGYYAPMIKSYYAYQQS